MGNKRKLSNSALASLVASTEKSKSYDTKTALPLNDITSDMEAYLSKRISEIKKYINELSKVDDAAALLPYLNALAVNLGRSLDDVKKLRKFNPKPDIKNDGVW